MSTIQRQEELIEKLQEAVSHYLNEGQFEIAKSYSELLKLACEAYRDLKGELKPQVAPQEVSPPQELPQRQPARPFDFSSRISKSPEQNQKSYQQKMQAEYAFINNHEVRQSLAEGYAGKITEYTNIQPQQQTKTVISGYTYGDGADNPKIRASDGVGNWRHEEPNVVITPSQQVIPNKFQQSAQQQIQLVYEDAWADNNNDMSFQDPRRNGFY